MSPCAQGRRAPVRARAPTRGATLLGRRAHFHTRALHAPHSCPLETCSSTVATCGTSDGARLAGTSLETNARDNRYSPTVSVRGKGGEAAVNLHGHTATCKGNICLKLNWRLLMIFKKRKSGPQILAHYEFCYNIPMQRLNKPVQRD